MIQARKTNLNKLVIFTRFTSRTQPLSNHLHLNNICIFIFNVLWKGEVLILIYVGQIGGESGHRNCISTQLHFSVILTLLAPPRGWERNAVPTPQRPPRNVSFLDFHMHLKTSVCRSDPICCPLSDRSGAVVRSRRLGRADPCCQKRARPSGSGAPESRSAGQ